MNNSKEVMFGILKRVQLSYVLRLTLALKNLRGMSRHAGEDRASSASCKTSCLAARQLR